MIKLTNLLNEIMDLYNFQDLDRVGIKYKIEEDTSNSFKVKLEYKGNYYFLRINPTFGGILTINFGNTNENYGELNLSKLLNSPHSSMILSAIFGLIRYWVDKWDIKQFDYAASGQVRNKLYKYYLEKHFSDFQDRLETDPEAYENEEPDTEIHIWTKK
jgi:hypothetical protein